MTKIETSARDIQRDGCARFKRQETALLLAFIDQTERETGRLCINQVVDELSVYRQLRQERANVAHPRTRWVLNSSMISGQTLGLPAALPAGNGTASTGRPRAVAR